MLAFLNDLVIFLNHEVLGQLVADNDESYQMHRDASLKIQTFVQNMIIGFFERCRHIPTKQKPDTTLQQFKEQQADQAPADHGTVDLYNHAAAVTGSHNPLMDVDWAMIDKVFSGWTAPDRPTDNETTGIGSGLGRQIIMVSKEPEVYDSHAPRATQQSSYIMNPLPVGSQVTAQYEASALPAQPITMSPRTQMAEAAAATPGHGYWNTPPHLTDPRAERAFEMSVNQEKVGDSDPRREPHIMPQGNLALRGFHERNSGQYRRPWWTGPKETGSRDSGVSVGSSYSGYGRATSGQFTSSRPIASSRPGSSSTLGDAASRGGLGNDCVAGCQGYSDASKPGFI